jgi:hypothetical protein
LSYAGKLLIVDKEITGAITPTNTAAINIRIKKGCYLIIEGFLDKSSNNIFLDVLVNNKIILVRIKKENNIEFLV